MALLVESLGEPPKERWRLFNEYYNVINRREKEREIPAAKLLNSFQADIDFIHQKVGVYLQVESERKGKTDALLKEDEFSEIINYRLVAEGHIGEKGESLKNDIIEAALERLVFLVAPQEGRVGFEIRSLQEFMAAQAITSGRDHEIIERLRSIAHASHWRNVFLFAAGRCFHEKQYLRDSIFAICSELNEGARDLVSCVNEVLLTGSELALDILDDGAISNQPSQLKIFTRLALRILELHPTLLHLRLSQAYYPEAEDLYRESILLRLDQIDFTARLGAWNVLIELADRDVSWARELAEKKWPNDPAEILSITSRMIARDPSRWLVDRWFSAILLSSPASAPFHYLLEFGGVIDATSEDMAISVPAWYSFLAKQIKAGVRREVSMNSVGDDIYFQVADLVYGADNKLESHEIGEVHPGWKWLYNCAKFLHVPDKILLADIILEASSLMMTSELFKLETWVWILPWQINAIVRSTNSSDELIRISSCIRKGELGDVSDWRLASERWGALGLKFEDINYVSSNKLPFDSNIAQFGFPVLSFQSDTRADDFEVELFDQLLALYKMDIPQSSKILLSNSMLTLISVIDEDSQLPDYVCEALPGILLSSEIEWVDLTMLNHMSREFWNSPKILELISALLSKVGSLMYDSSEIRVDYLTGLLKNRPVFRDGVVLLSKLMRVGRDVDFSTSIEVIESTEDLDLKEAYIIIALSKLDCLPNDALRMADLLDEMTLSLESGNYLYCVIEMLRESNEVTKATEAFLYSLLNKKIAEGYGSRRDIVSLLRQHQAYHLSHNSECLR
ncbi:MULTISPECIES: NACHT domain-containing protein [Pseudomonas]|uniref:NACHT domain-containing protein n=1 Tax=Pseudomonas TaxID=286 RepID=UPI0039902972